MIGHDHDLILENPSDAAQEAEAYRHRGGHRPDAAEAPSLEPIHQRTEQKREQDGNGDRFKNLACEIECGDDDDKCRRHSQRKFLRIGHARDNIE